MGDDRMNFEQISRKSAAVKRKYGNAAADEILQAKDIAVLDISMGTSEKALKGFIMKSSRMVTIVLNADLPADIHRIVCMHETSHYLLGHLNGRRQVVFQDSSLAYRNDHTHLARMENEANFFAADYLIDTRETIEAIHELDFFSAAKNLGVPPQLLDYKLRLLYGLGYLEKYQDCLFVKSDCMRTLQSDRPNLYDIIC